MVQSSVMPKVSVIMPAYNAEKYIEEAVKSVIDQTVTDWELIIIDDCSKDGTLEIIKRLSQQDNRIIVKENEKNSGVAKTRNYGMGYSRGIYVAFLDSDDVWHRDKLEKQIACLEAKNADISYASYSLMDEEGRKVYNEFVVPGEVNFERMLACNFFGCSTVMLKREVVNKYKFNLSFFHEDYVLWLQLLREGYKAAGVTESLVDYRVMQDSKSGNKWKSAKQRWDIYRNYLNLSLVESMEYSMKYAAKGVLKFQKHKL